MQFPRRQAVPIGAIVGALALLAALALPAFAQEAAGPAPNVTPASAIPDQRLLSLLFLGYVVLVCAAVGRWVLSLRRDFVRMLGPAADGPLATERIELFRDAQAGLPEGTIRAALGLLVVAILLPALVLSRTLGLQSTGEIGTILGSILGFYFGTRSGGGEAEGYKRLADANGNQAREQEAAAKQAEAERKSAEEARIQAEQSRDTVAQERDIVVQQADTRVAEARTGALAETAESQAQLLALQARARQALAVAQAVAGMLPAGPAARAITGSLATAGGVLDEAAQAGAAVQAAIGDPTPASIGNALDAARGILRRAGEGTEIADRLGAALDALHQTTDAAGRVQEAIRNPSAGSVADALMAASGVLTATGGGGFAATLAPALGTIGTVLRMPGLGSLGGLGGLAGMAPPVAIVGGIVLGAWQAWKIGNQHYTRWMARVLDRPVTPDLFPAAAWDGAAARVLIGGVPALARVFKTELETGSQQEMAELLATLFRADAVTELLRQRGGAFASEVEADSAVNELRRRVLDQELDRDSSDPVQLPGGRSMPQPEFRAALDRLREAGAGGAIEGLGLLASTLIRARPTDAQGNAIAVDLPKLLEDALPLATQRPEAAAKDPPAPPPPVEGASP
jgi:hypothetical protein